ncbi:DUF2493 domain-containing protein [Nocardia ninae]|uniref:YspA cpYpsA-related SLOG domain-containing protein n=1 Tax=Nocardia ninae NBRC 108245 TaxID=1210091 RepID=A0A511MA02_9NOCA|nr:DUF2493 domain-containing protein [Nocardia ninae]GEM37492.1 hypothetical protein NN4_20110 [Nocardia ninae NBRC 108245]
MSARILFTGSRRWTDYDLLKRVLVSVWTQLGCPPDLELVHGGARGADRMAAAIWSGLGLPVRTVPADWDRYGKPAGVIRNQQMVDLGGYVHAVAALLPGSRGTHDCVRRIERAAIPLTIATGDQPAVPVLPERRGI